MSGWLVIQFGWSVSAGGRDTMLIGETEPFIMIVSEPMPTDIFSQWAMASRKTE
jgi:hypothetical protein